MLTQTVTTEAVLKKNLICLLQIRNKSYEQKFDLGIFVQYVIQ